MIKTQISNLLVGDGQPLLVLAGPCVIESEELTRVTEAFKGFREVRAPEIDGFRKAVSFSTILFWAMAALVGTVQGGIQAVSRSYFGKLIPKKRSNEFFGFFDIFGKFASVLGPFLYATIGAWTGRSSFGVLALIVLFLAGLVIMITGSCGHCCLMAFRVSMPLKPGICSSRNTRSILSVSMSNASVPEVTGTTR